MWVIFMNYGKSMLCSKSGKTLCGDTEPLNVLVSGMGLSYSGGGINFCHLTCLWLKISFWWDRKCRWIQLNLIRLTPGHNEVMQAAQKLVHLVLFSTYGICPKQNQSEISFSLNRLYWIAEINWPLIKKMTVGIHMEYGILDICFTVFYHKSLKIKIK